MFVQVIKGHTTDPDGFLAHGERFEREIRPGATGFLGGTVGVADDGTFVIIARFEDEAAARANEARPEQSAFFEDGRRFFDGEPTFRESTDVHLLLDGPSDEAGFVQVMEGTASDRAKADALETPELIEQLRAARPDLLGAIRVWFDGGKFVEAAYFTSEEAARKGESSADFSRPNEEFSAVFGDLSYTDLRRLAQ